MKSLIQRIADDFSVLDSLTGPIWKLSERYGESDDETTYVAFLSLARAGAIEERWTNGQPKFLRLFTEISETMVGAAEQIFARTQAKLAA